MRNTDANNSLLPQLIGIAAGTATLGRDADAALVLRGRGQLAAQDLGRSTEDLSGQVAAAPSPLLAERLEPHERGVGDRQD